MGFGRKALLLGGALALGAAVSAAEQAEAERVRKARQLNGDQLAWLTVLAVLALGVAVGIAKAGGGFMVLIPLIAWAYALRGFRNANERRARQAVVTQGVSREARKQASPVAPAPKRDDATIPRFELERRQREQQRRESVARRDAERVKRVEDLGPQGAKLYEQAQSAVRRILSTEAIRSGWFGDLQEADFSADLEMIASNSRKANELQRLINELSAIPNPNIDDQALLGEATRKVAELDRQSVERVEVLENCWEKTKLMDVAVREEREQAALADKRDDVHGRMAAALYAADATPDRPSSAADRVLAFEAAYREIKGQNERDALSAQEHPEVVATNLEGSRFAARVRSLIRRPRNRKFDVR